MPSPGGKNLMPGSTLSQFKRPARKHGHVARGSRRHSLKRRCQFGATLRSAVYGGQRNFPPVPGCLPCPAQETIRFSLRKSFKMASPWGTASLCCDSRYLWRLWESILPRSWAELPQRRQCDSAPQKKNEVRDVGQLASTGYSYVVYEPVVWEHGVGGNRRRWLSLRPWSARGVEPPKRSVALLQDCQHWCCFLRPSPCPGCSGIRRCAKESEAQQACAYRRADFTPFICSTMVPSIAKASTFSGAFRHGWRRSGRCHTVAMSFVNMRLSLAILRASVHCLPGAQRTFFSLALERLWSSHRLLS